jgi:hypothetical protein
MIKTSLTNVVLNELLPGLGEWPPSQTYWHVARSVISTSGMHATKDNTFHIDAWTSRMRRSSTEDVEKTFAFSEVKAFQNGTLFVRSNPNMWTNYHEL